MNLENIEQASVVEGENELDVLQETTRRKKRFVFIGAGVALAVALAGGGAWGASAWQHHNAYVAYASAHAAEEGAVVDLQDAVKAAQEARRQGFMAGVVGVDMNRLDALLEASQGQRAMPGPVVKETSTTRLRDMTRSMVEHEHALRAHINDLREQTTKVIEAAKKMRIEAAQKNLTHALDVAEEALADAEKALTDTDGKVLDNQVRVDLENVRTSFSQQVGDARKETTNQDASRLEETVKRVQEATNALATQTQKVRDARVEWDKEQTLARRNSGGGSAAAPSRGNGGNGGGYSAPARGNGGGTTNNNTGASSGGWVETTTEEDVCQTGVLGQDGRPITNC